MLGLATAQAQNAPLKMTLFGQPSVNNDAIWMAIEKGFYQQEGLDVTYRLFPSGTTAFQAFQTGQGDIVMTGDLPSVQYFFRVKGDYRTIAVIERDAKGYVVAGKDIDAAGSCRQDRRDAGVWIDRLLVRFEYLTKNKVDPKPVTMKNLDTRSCRRRCAAVKSQPSSSGSRSARAHSRRSAQTRRTISATRPATSRAIWSPARGPNGSRPRKARTSQHAGCARR